MPRFPERSGIISSVEHLVSDGVFLGRSVQCDGGNLVFSADQQRLVVAAVCRGHMRRIAAFCSQQGANQVAVLLSGFILCGRHLVRSRPFSITVGAAFWSTSAPEL